MNAIFQHSSANDANSTKKTSQFDQSGVDMSKAMELHSVFELEQRLRQSAVGLLAPLKAILQLTIAKLACIFKPLRTVWVTQAQLVHCRAWSFDPQSTEQPSVVVFRLLVVAVINRLQNKTIFDNLVIRGAIVVLTFQVTETINGHYLCFESLYLQ